MVPPSPSTKLDGCLFRIFKSVPPGVLRDGFFFIHNSRENVSFCHVLRLFEPGGCAHTDRGSQECGQCAASGLGRAGLAPSISRCEAKQHDI